MRRLIRDLAIGLSLAVIPGLSASLAAQTPAPAGDTPDICVDGMRVLEPENVWDGTPPGMDEWAGTLDVPVRESVASDGKHIFNVTTPTYQAFLPAPECATGAAVMVAPGGGFWLLAIDHEGRHIARSLEQRRVAAFVLKYRLVQYENLSLDQKFRRTLPEGAAAEAAIADGKQALRLIRSQSGRFGIDADRVGAIGFSADGHLVMTLGLDAAERNRPAFIGKIYGAFFNEVPPKFPPANLPYPPDAPEEIWLRPTPGALPPIFMAVAQDDTAVKLGFDALEDALEEAGYRSEVHRYMNGGHGFGVRSQGLTSDRFIDQFHAWMGVIGMLEPAAQPE